MNLKKLGIVASMMILLFIFVWIALAYLEFEYAYMPSKNQVEFKENRKDEGAYDVWGKLIPKEEADKMLKSKDHVGEILSLKNGAVKINDQLLDLGRETFYKETFGNEVFLTDVMGVTNGPLTMTTEGKKEPLPDPVALETEVDKIFLKWPRGNFDSSIDLKSNPTQVPDSYTLGDHPYGWSGFAQAGPFKGLTVFSNNVHAQNADSLSQSEISKALFGIDKEVYLGTILQNAANPTYRFNPAKNEKPSDFFKKVDPTPHAPGVNEMIKPQTFPNISLVAPDGLIVSSPGFKANEQNNAVAGWQNILKPPKPKIKRNQALAKEGERVFNKAGCISCHAGNTLTNNKVISSYKIGTEPSRAQALKKTEKIFDESKMYAPSSNVPIKENARVLDVPVKHLDQKQIELAFSKANSPGGYKVSSFVGLYWSAPYLHDGGVAVGPDIQNQLGMAGTLMKGIIPDPSNSLRALIDRRLREKVVAANLSSNDLKVVRIKGTGHEYWVDESTDFTKQEQEALIHYLLTFSPSINEFVHLIRE